LLGDEWPVPVLRSLDFMNHEEASVPSRALLFAFSVFCELLRLNFFETGGRWRRWQHYCTSYIEKYHSRYNQQSIFLVAQDFAVRWHHDAETTHRKDGMVSSMVPRTTSLN